MSGEVQHWFSIISIEQRNEKLQKEKYKGVYVSRMSARIPSGEPYHISIRIKQPYKGGNASFNAFSYWGRQSQEEGVLTTVDFMTNKYFINADTNRSLEADLNNAAYDSIDTIQYYKKNLHCRIMGYLHQLLLNSQQMTWNRI
ncbi:unnamed protein product [Leptidea sinapis]|uniref:Uncharacterized protein n=1 Tax=Leptidea sinapis TaxID=189913 RepID=A0A5E4QBJ2_9NEOP|nr:unnamed protein product [Leptidea sinapis]